MNPLFLYYDVITLIACLSLCDLCAATLSVFVFFIYASGGQANKNTTITTVRLSTDQMGLGRFRLNDVL